MTVHREYVEDKCDYCGQMMYWHDPDDPADGEGVEGWHAEQTDLYCPDSPTGYHLADKTRA